MTATEFDPWEPVAAGRTVIEASAGTGKTFTIAAIVTRLVAIEGIDIEQILVVTFTRAATAELRDRVRRRLVDTLAALDGAPPQTPDMHLTVLLTDVEQRPVYADRVRKALTRFDRAQIFTIHGFAQRLLRHLGFASRLSPELEPGEVDDLLVSQVVSDLLVGRFATDSAGMPALADVNDVGRAVVATPDARIVPEPGEVDGVARCRVELAGAVRQEVGERLRRNGAATFDDALFEVRDALDAPTVREAAMAMLRKRYAIGLVDESQDTDPIQWQVIRAVFDTTRLVVIGDPKQSIYSFRGADVESYLSAIDGATAHRTLATNWRSDGKLIEALDVLLRGAVFGDERIAYHTVQSPPDRPGTRIRNVAVLSIRCFAKDLPILRKQNGKGDYVIAEARKVVAADAAAEVVRLLENGEVIDDGGGERRLGPNDIAVLCRTRKQVDLVRGELRRRNVPSVAARTGGVFAGAAAEEWRRLLVALERPDRADMARLAAVTVFCGHAPHEVAAMEDGAILDLQTDMREWRDRLHQDGVPALISAIDRRTDLAARVLALPDGERLMTDITHIAEEMHAVWRRGRLVSPLGWLETAMAETQARESGNREEPEARQRRLETDAAAVTVQTVHGAKGLQYPAVLVPFAWDVPRFTPANPVFHDPAAPAGATPRPRLIDVAGDGWSGHKGHVDHHQAEDRAEEGRQLYVALTRAQHCVVVWWLPDATGAHDTKLGELLTRIGPDPVTLIAESRGLIDAPDITAPPPLIEWQPPSSPLPTLDRARFDRRLDYEWRRASFTSLSPEHPLVAAPETAEELRRDDEIGAESYIDESVGSAGVALPMADLPRGARFGTLVHDILERVGFTDPALPAAVRAAVDEALRGGGWDLDPETLTSSLVAAIETPLGPEPAAVRLCDLPTDRMLKEMTFELPVRTSGGPVSLRDIGGVMLDHLPSGDPYRRYANDLRALAATRFHGYLTGAIDLTTEIDGRFVVVDFKTNPMPVLGDVASPHDYGPVPLRAAMIEGNYVLQATLYQVALHRYLEWRLAGYEPSTHLGGAAYLFVRGMAGRGTPVTGGERCGVVRWTPPPAMTVALSQLLAGSGDGS